MIKRLLPKAQINDYEVVERSFPSLISQFDLAAHSLKSPLKFVCELYNCLYQGLKFKDLLNQIPKTTEEEATWPKWDEVVAELRQNETLKAVGELLIVDQGQHLRRNPQILAVLTTNADNLLEIYCRARTGGKSRILTLVDRASVGDHPDRTSIYHLHGTLDARGENIVQSDSHCDASEFQKIDDELLPELVFRESDYYETIANPQIFVNHVPQSYFQRLNVLFVGTSLDDLNIRAGCTAPFVSESSIARSICASITVGFTKMLSARRNWNQSVIFGSGPKPRVTGRYQQSLWN